MLELAILGLLLESPMHGYELRKRLTGLLGAFRAFSYGSLYPALRRMQADGLIVEDAAPDGTRSCAARGASTGSPTPASSGSPNWWPTPVRRTTPTTGSAFTSRSSTARRPRPGCGSWRGAVVRWRNAARVCVKRWRGPAARSTATPASCTSSGLESSEREVKWLNELIAAERTAQGRAEQP